MKNTRILAKVLLLTFAVIIAVSLFTMGAFAAERPCYHAETAGSGKIEVVDNSVVYSYVCSKCENKVSIKKSDESLYDASLNTGDDAVKFDSNGSFTISGLKKYKFN